MQILLPRKGRPRTQGCRERKLQVQLQPLTLTVLILLTLPAPAATTTNFCPTYNTAIVVDYVDATPKTATEGMMITTKFHVTYPEGTPAEISNASFLWTGAAGQKEYENIQVSSNGTAGFYVYRQDITPDLIHAVGRQATISVVACSLHDVYGNDGPNQPTNSETTPNPNDNSHVTLTFTKTKEPTPTTTAAIAGDATQTSLQRIQIGDNA
jgi:hypothetical protein